MIDDEQDWHDWHTPAGNRRTRELPEWLQREAEALDYSDRRRRSAFLAGLLVGVVAFAAAALLAVPVVANWIEDRATPAWEGNR